jgi:AraC-like DNA-binding protein
MARTAGLRAAPELADWAVRCGATGGATLETRPMGDVTLVRLTVAGGAGGELTFTPPRGQVLLAALVAGVCAFKDADARPRQLRRQQVLLALGGAPLTLAPEAGARLAAVAAPAHVLNPRFVTAERLAAAALMSHGGGVAALLCDLISRTSGGETRAPGAGFVDAIGGLLSATLEDCGRSQRLKRGAAAGTRREQIGGHLRRHFADPELSAADVARAVGVSRRYLHRLYAEAGRSFREELIALRIAACLAAFRDGAQADRTIAEIAYAAGYADISQFNRHFRRLNGETPSALRRAARQRELQTTVSFGRSALTAA